MAELLGNVDGLDLLEPSVGNGSLLGGLKGSPAHIDAIDVDGSVLALTKQRFSYLPIQTHRADFIDMFVNGPLLQEYGQLRRSYDAVISNPPFGLFFSPEYRKRLKASFPDLYVRESYGLFLAFSLLMLRDEGRYVFLLPDTFLTSTNHSSLRRFIYNVGEPSHVVRFPSKRFETVNFGYGNLCIIAGYKRPTAKQAVVTWTEAFVDQLPLLDQPKDTVFSICGADLNTFLSSGWRVGMAEVRTETQNWTTLGEVADCKTGIYTGDNCRFIGYDPARIHKRLNGHSIRWDSVYEGDLSPTQQQGGLDGTATYVPLVRGGHRAFTERTAWALRWDSEAVRFYKTNKKARLQNAGFYFRPGIAVPMVTSRRLSASLMENAVFDQGVVGVFPADKEAREAILLYLNSSKATELRNEIVNGSANNSANYLKRLPIPRFEQQNYAKAKQIVSDALKGGVLRLDVCDQFVEGFLTRQGKL